MSNIFAHPSFSQFVLIPCFLGVFPYCLMENQERKSIKSKFYYLRGLFLSGVMITLRSMEVIFYSDVWLTDAGSLEIIFILARFSSSINSSVVVFCFHYYIDAYRRLLCKELSGPAEKSLAKLTKISNFLITVFNSYFTVQLFVGICLNLSSNNLYPALMTSLYFLNIWMSVTLECLCLYYFHVTCYVVYIVMLANFDHANANLERCLSCASTLTVVHLLAARELHETAREHVNFAVRLFSPALAYVLLTHSVIMCFLSYSVISSVLINNFTQFGMVTVIIIYFFICVIFHCHCGQRITYKSTSGLKYIYRADLAYISPECRFQLKMLESMMNSKPVVLSASGFANVNHGLLVQVFGVVVTYVLVMVQFRKDT